MYYAQNTWINEAINVHEMSARRCKRLVRGAMGHGDVDSSVQSVREEIQQGVYNELAGKTPVSY